MKKYQNMKNLIFHFLPLLNEKFHDILLCVISAVNRKDIGSCTLRLSCNVRNEIRCPNSLSFRWRLLQANDARMKYFSLFNLYNPNISFLTSCNQSNLFFSNQSNFFLWKSSSGYRWDDYVKHCIWIGQKERKVDKEQTKKHNSKEYGKRKSTWQREMRW